MPSSYFLGPGMYLFMKDAYQTKYIFSSSSFFYLNILYIYKYFAVEQDLLGVAVVQHVGAESPVVLVDPDRLHRRVFPPELLLCLHSKHEEEWDLDGGKQLTVTLLSGVDCLGQGGMADVPPHLVAVDCESPSSTEASRLTMTGCFSSRTYIPVLLDSVFGTRNLWCFCWVLLRNCCWV